MKEEELLNRVTHWRKSLHKDYPSLQLDWTKKDEQAYQQIKEMIQKPKVSKEFIGKVVARIYCDRKSSKAIKTHIREAFEMAGVEVEK